MIRSFADKRTAAIWADRMPKGFPADLAKAARRKLRMLAAATQLEDLRNPPGNHLETLLGDRAGQHSIRVNDQWRLCFVWRDNDAYDVEIADYHQEEVRWASVPSTSPRRTFRMSPAPTASGR